MTTIPKPRRVKVLLNAGAGAATEPGFEQSVRELELAFAAHEVAASVQALPPDVLRTEADHAVQEAARGELDAIVAAGGDGTLRAVAAAVAGSGVPLGVIPSGTRNHFAKDLGLPLEMDAAVDVIVQGHSGAVDVGEVNGRIFLNNSSIGLYPYLVLGRERQRRRRRLSKWLAMLLALPRVVKNLPLRRLRIAAGDSVEVHRSPCVFVGNNEYQLEGLDFGTRSTLTSGKLWLCIARQESFTGLVWVGLRTILGLLDVQRDLQPMSVSEVTIRSSRRLLVAMDGEIEAIRGPLIYRARPASLRVFQPASDAAVVPANEKVRLLRPSRAPQRRTEATRS